MNRTLRTDFDPSVARSKSHAAKLMHDARVDEDAVVSFERAQDGDNHTVFGVEGRVVKVYGGSGLLVEVDEGWRSTPATRYEESKRTSIAGETVYVKTRSISHLWVYEDEEE